MLRRETLTPPLRPSLMLCWPRCTSKKALESVSGSGNTRLKSFPGSTLPAAKSRVRASGKKCWKNFLEGYPFPPQISGRYLPDIWQLSFAEIHAQGPCSGWRQACSWERWSSHGGVCGPVASAVPKCCGGKMLCVSKSYILSLTFILSFTISFLSAGSRNVGVNPKFKGNLHFEPASSSTPIGEGNSGRWFKRVAAPLVLFLV